MGGIAAASDTFKASVSLRARHTSPSMEVRLTVPHMDELWRLAKQRTYSTSLRGKRWMMSFIACRMSHLSSLLVSTFNRIHLG